MPCVDQDAFRRFDTLPRRGEPLRGRVRCAFAFANRSRCAPLAALSPATDATPRRGLARSTSYPSHTGLAARWREEDASRRRLQSTSRNEHPWIVRIPGAPSRFVRTSVREGWGPLSPLPDEPACLEMIEEGRHQVKPRLTPRPRLRPGPHARAGVGTAPGSAILARLLRPRARSTVHPLTPRFTPAVLVGVGHDYASVRISSPAPPSRGAASPTRGAFHRRVLRPRATRNRSPPPDSRFSHHDPASDASSPSNALARRG